MREHLPFAGCVALILACAPATDRPPILSHTPVMSPSGDGSAEPNLVVDHAGRVHFSWLQRTSDSTFAMRYAVRDGEAWSAPVSIVERSDLFVNWADFPSVHVSQTGRLVAHWLQRSGTGRYAYDVVIRQSADGGTSWSEPVKLNTDGVAGEHGFLSFVEAPGDSVDAFWLDGRATAGHDGHGGAMQLATSRIASDGGFTTNAILDTRICDCCQTSAALTSNGPVVVYRDRSDDEVRDISIVRQVNHAWTTPTRVHADNWQIDACPVNGPAIAAHASLVTVAWFTGARDTARVSVAFSTDAGATFGDVIQVDDGRPLGRVDVELDGTDRAIVTWLEGTADGDAEVRMRAIASDGRRSPATVIARSSAGRPAGFPRLARTAQGLLLAWTQPGEPSRILMAEGPLASPVR